MSSSENMKDVFEEYSKTRDVELRNQIVEHYLYIVDILIRKYLNRGVEYEDLYQVGSMALILAVERFDASKGFEFTSFATPTIIGEIKRYFRDKGWAMKVPRRLKEVSLQLPKVKEKLEQTLSHPPTVREIAAYMGINEELVLEAMESSRSYGTYSLQQTFDDTGEEGNAFVFEKYLGKEEPGFQGVENAEVIRNIYQEMSPKEQEIFRLRFLEEKTQQDIAERYGISQMTVSRVEKKLRDKLKTAYNL